MLELKPKKLTLDKLNLLIFTNHETYYKKYNKSIIKIYLYNLE